MLPKNSTECKDFPTHLSIETPERQSLRERDAKCVTRSRSRSQNRKKIRRGRLKQEVLKKDTTNGPEDCSFSNLLNTSDANNSLETSDAFESFSSSVERKSQSLASQPAKTESEDTSNNEKQNALTTSLETSRLDAFHRLPNTTSTTSDTKAMSC